MEPLASAFIEPFRTFTTIAGCSRTAANKVMTQPTPEVTTDDVHRIIRRDFGESRFSEVQTVLSSYGTKDWQQGTARVHLAILKLSAGDLSQLRQHTEIACSDYRDVLTPAEYRRYSNLAWSGESGQTAEQNAIRDDWSEYQTWLTRR